MDWIAVSMLFVTSLTTISSIVIAVLTLKQNSNMIEESSRPVVLIYKDIFNFNSPLEYLVIKNFGNSAAYITNIDFNKDSLIKISLGLHTCDKAFEALCHSTIAPGQSFKIPIKTKNSNIDSIDFVIDYKNVKHYTDKITINLNQDRDIAFCKQSQDGKELRDICNAIQESTKRLS